MMTKLVEKENVIQVKNDLGVPINVRICKEKLFGEWSVQFFDARFKSTEYGRYIDSYYADTIARHVGKLQLDFFVEEWRLSRKNIEEIQLAIEKTVYGE